jgi:hypothetical protein
MRSTEAIISDIETKLVKNGRLNKWISNDEWVKKNNLEKLLTEISDLFVIETISTTQKIKCLLTNKSASCTCGNELVSEKDFNQFVCHACRKSKREETRKKTTLEKYGVDHISKLQSVKDKYKNTCLEKYGVEHSFKSIEVQEKRIATIVDRYGVVNPFQSNEIRDKIKESTQMRYGVDNYSSTEECKRKRIATSLVNYGTEYPLQNKELRDKLRLTRIKNYLNAFDEEQISAISNIKQIYEDEHVNGGNTISYISKKYRIPFNYLKSLLNDLDLSIVRRYYTSQGEQILFDYISSIYKGMIIRNDRKVLGNQFELDIFLPELNFAIEYHGSYWHSNINELKHHDKATLANEKGIRLLQIFDFELEEKEELIKSIIKSHLVNNTKIFARKCKVKEITAKEYREFVEENHLQGYSPAKIKLGLFHENELVSIMSFSKPRNSDKYDYEMIRLCTKKETTIVGGATKQFKYFLDNYEFDSVVTFADRRFFDGSIYENLGFDYSHTTKPNYWYTSGSDKISRIAAQKHKLKDLLKEKFDPELSEKDNMISSGYRIVHDAGNRAFLFNRGSNL